MNDSMKLKRLIFPLLFALLPTACVDGFVRGSRPQTSNYEGLLLQGAFERVAAFNATPRFAGRAGDQLLITANSDLSPQEAEALARRRMDYLLTFLEPHRDPYFGVRDPGETCRRASLPTPQWKSKAKGAEFSMLQLFATADLVFGACSNQLDQMKTQILWLYCPVDKTLYELRYFYSRHEGWRSEPIAFCR